MTKEEKRNQRNLQKKEALERIRKKEAKKERK
jgi:hypothetical protein